MNDLKPLSSCPLCGATAEIHRYKPNYIWSIGCSACKLWIQFAGPQELDKSIAIWNTRPTAKIVEELRGIVSELAAWSKRWPKQVIYSVTRQQKCEVELLEIEERAIALTKKHSLPETKGGNET